MSLTLNDLVLESKTFDMEFGDKVMSITYDPNQITSDAIADMGSSTDETCRVLSELILDWDLVDANANKVKPTFEFFSGLKLAVVNKILQSVFDDAFPKAESTQSSATFRRKARR